jgi:serine/threonine protein kinase
LQPKIETVYCLKKMGKGRTSNSGGRQESTTSDGDDGSNERGPSSSEGAHEPDHPESPTDPSVLKVVAPPDEAELDTDSSAGSLYEILSDKDVEDMHDSSQIRTVLEPSVGSAGRADHSPDTASGRGPVYRQDTKIGVELSGRYTIERLIGKGGMGRVYLAKQRQLNRMVAIKILNRSFQNKDPQFSERFYLEAATAASLNHPNSITVFDYGESETGELYIVMEYLKGQPLARLINRGGPLPPERTIRIALHLARALRAAHKKGIIHRDLKPGNVMVLDHGDDPETAKVLDFGLVKLFQNPDQEEDPESFTPVPMPGQELTRAGMFLGSPKYMSPEQIQNDDLDPRTDIYSLGIILFYMLAGRQPYVGKGSIDIVYQHMHAKLPRINDVNPEVLVPEELENVVRRCLEKDRELRYGSMSELLESLLEVLALVSNSSASYSYQDSSDISGSLSGRLSRKAVSPTGTNDQRSDAQGEIHRSIGSKNERVSTQFGKRSTLRFMLIVLFSVLAFGGGAYFVTVNQNAAPSTAPGDLARKPSESPRGKPAPPRFLTLEVSFVSDPSGATVQQGGRVLGVTPFTHRHQLQVGQTTQQIYLVSKAGFRNQRIQRELGDSNLEIYISLEKKIEKKPTKRRTKKQRPRRKSKQNQVTDNDEDYKDNPY